MDNHKDDQYYAKKAIEDITAIEAYIKGKTYEEFVDDALLMDAVMFRLIQLIENIKKISFSFKEAHTEIPWGEIVGFRNGIVHEYGVTDYTVVYETITQDLVQLKTVLAAVELQ